MSPERVCYLCDEPLPIGRHDDICEDCRFHRIIRKRLTRPKIAPTDWPVVVSGSPEAESMRKP